MFYVYVVFDLEAIPRYIGKGKGDRWKGHLWRSHNVDLRRLIIKAGLEVPIVIVRDGLTEQEAYETEIALIAAIGRGMDGPLLNLTDGGDGVVGRKQTPGQIEKLRLTRIGRVHSKEMRAKISAALKGKPKTPEHRAAAAAGRKGKGTGPMSEAHRKAFVSGRWRVRDPKQLPLL